MAESQQTLFDRIGGEAAIERVIEHFYTRVFDDVQLAPWFADVDTAKLRRMQVEFFTTALGGPPNYAGMTLAEAHRGRGIGPAQVARFTEHLLATLTTMGLPPDDVDAVMGRVNLLAAEVLDDSGEAG